MKKNEFLGLLEGYFNEYLPTTRGVSANTIRSYQYAFRLLFQFLYECLDVPPQKVTFKTLEGDTIPDFLSWLENERQSSIATRNQRLAAILSFSRYTRMKSFQACLPFNNAVQQIPKKKACKKDMAYFTKEEMSILLSLPGTHAVAEKRDRVLLSVLYASGARAQELCDLQVKDIGACSDKTSLKLHGKGRKTRVVVIPDDCARLLQSHLKSNHLKDKDCGDRHVFSSKTHEHMTISCVEAVVKKYVNLARGQNPGLFREKKYTPHSFRHSVAVHMLEAGIPIVVIKNFLGHSSIETTMVYATVSQALRDKYLAAYNEARAAVAEPARDESPSLSMPDFLNTR